MIIYSGGKSFRQQPKYKKEEHTILQRIRTYFLSGSTIVQLTSCLTEMNSVTMHTLKLKQISLFVWIKTSQTGGQLYNDTLTYIVSK